MFNVVGFISLLAVMFWVYYSLLGGTPLLIAKYETANDSRLVRGFFHVHYKFLMLFAALGAMSFSILDNKLLASALACEFALGLIAMRLIVGRMDRIRNTMAALDIDATRSFRKIISGALALNLVNFLTMLAVVYNSTLIHCTKTPPDCVLGQKIDGQAVPCTHVCSIF